MQDFWKTDSIRFKRQRPESGESAENNLRKSAAVVGGIRRISLKREIDNTNY